MGPQPTSYFHPTWVPAYGDHGDDEGAPYISMYYQYPETPEYGFFVQSFDKKFFYVGPVRFLDNFTAERSGTAYYFDDVKKITKHVDSMYVKGQQMSKAHNITDLIDLELAPF